MDAPPVPLARLFAEAITALVAAFHRRPRAGANIFSLARNHIGGCAYCCNPGATLSDLFARGRARRLATDDCKSRCC